MQAQNASAPDRLKALFELSNDLCSVLSRGGIFEWVNPAWERVLGWKPDELIGSSAFELMHPDDLARTREANAESSGTEVVNFENRYRHKDGSWCWLLWSATKRDGCWYAIAKNVTGLRQSRDKVRPQVTVFET